LDSLGCSALCTSSSSSSDLRSCLKQFSLSLLTDSNGSCSADCSCRCSFIVFFFGNKESRFSWLLLTSDLEKQMRIYACSITIWPAISPVQSQWLCIRRHCPGPIAADRNKWPTVRWLYRCPINTRPVSPLFRSGPSPARPNFMWTWADPTRVSGPDSDRKLGTVG
jgi:hypothetical protein